MIVLASSDGSKTDVEIEKDDKLRSWREMYLATKRQMLLVRRRPLQGSIVKDGIAYDEKMILDLKAGRMDSTATEESSDKILKAVVAFALNQITSGAKWTGPELAKDEDEDDK